MPGRSIARRFAISVGVVCPVLALGIGAFFFAAQAPGMDPIVPPPANSFASNLVQRGATLAAIGNCDVCHTAPGGREFAGGRALQTPFGTVYGTKITPDAQSGIVTWSQAAFTRAMRSSVRRDGAYLYAAFPYDHFTLISDEDNAALYAFLMTRAPVHAMPPTNPLQFSLNIR